MKVTAIIATLFAGVALAIPTGGGGGGGGAAAYDPCSGLYDTAECCATDVLGVADLDCAPPPTVPVSAATFSSACAAIGQRARCCVLPVLGQAVLCQTPVGVDD
ncbi:fungal hydrophobin [Schizothecium vesticola]|uniref:Fungal hydrophobin n=1 Tax=Schizothecium vesticola TaxID=314040 RepID=A0AA40EX80_9PEZI|nr:fungal hydrophobin [Schizothecium vesticola]